MEQVLTNLLTNATKYAAGKPIEITLRVKNNKAKLLVQDHGMGISKKNHNRIFERFERAASIEKYSGLGLGLLYHTPNRRSPWRNKFM